MYLCTRIKNTGNKSSIDKGISSVLKSKDPLAQLVEHNTFNVGVLGSSPKRITRIPAESQESKEDIEDFTTSKVLFLYLYN